jgi:hypothetical protein
VVREGNPAELALLVGEPYTPLLMHNTNQGERNILSLKLTSQ